MTNRDRCLELLERQASVTTADFLNAGCGSRFGARLLELRDEGYIIESEYLRAGSHRYTLTGRTSLPVDTASQTPSGDVKPPAALPAGGSTCWTWTAAKRWHRAPIPAWAYFVGKDVDKELSETATATAGREGRSQGDPITDNRRATDPVLVAIPVPGPDASESIGPREAAA